MTTETNDLAGAGSEIVAPEPVETPEVTTPESSAEQPQQQEESKDDSENRRTQRRIDRLTKARYEAQAEARYWREQAEQLKQSSQPNAEEGQPQQFRPEDVERMALERAQHMREMESVSKRSTEIRDALVKEVGGEKLRDVLTTVIEEAGELAKPDGRWTPLGEAIADCDAPAAVLRYLAENPDTAAELKGLSATRLGRRLDTIEREMKDAKVSKAPAPIKPVNPKGAPLTKAESDMTDAEWYAARRKR